MGKLFDETMQGLLEAIAIENETLESYEVENMPAITIRTKKESISDFKK